MLCSIHFVKIFTFVKIDFFVKPLINWIKEFFPLTEAQDLLDNDLIRNQKMLSKKPLLNKEENWESTAKKPTGFMCLSSWQLIISEIK
jgi:hypothetical protein